MAREATLPRWMPLLLAVVGSTTVGMFIYAWSVFIKPLNAQFGWSRAEIALAFGIACLVYGFATFPAGRLSDRFGPRIVVGSGSILFATGFVLSGCITSNNELYLTYGVLAALGGAMVFLPHAATAPKWWPDRRGLATGFALGGIGLGSFIMGPLATWIISVSGWRAVFWYCGIGMGLLAGLSSLPLAAPPPGWQPAGWTPPHPAAGAPKAIRDYTHAESIRTAQFRLLYFIYFCISFAGLIVIGHIAGHGRDAGLSAMAAGWAVSCLAFGITAGRFLTGVSADRLGMKTICVVWGLLEVMALLLLFPAGGSWWALCLVAALIGWTYGGISTLFPVFCMSYFGPTAQASNYGLLLSAWGLAGISGPYLGGYLKDATGSYLVPFGVGALVAAISLIASAMLQPPAKLAAK